MGFSQNSKKATEGFGDLKKPGEYECLIVKAEERTSRTSGTAYLSIDFIIRNDVEQQYKNSHIFYALFKKKEPTQDDMEVGGYAFGMVMNLGKAARLPDGKEYENLAAYLSDLVGKTIRVKLEHDNYREQVREKVTALNETKFSECKHVMKQPQATVNDAGFAQRSTTYANPTVEYSNPISAMAEEDLPF